MIQPGADFALVGPTYEAPAVLHDAENCINWYVEIAEDKNAKTPIALLGCPGLNATITLPTGPVRGTWPLPGGNTALAVGGNTLYLITVTVPPTQSSIAQFAITTIGTLATNSGPVVMRDNGVLQGGLGGFCLIVDGSNGYFYTIGGARTATFTAGTTNTLATLTLPGALPAGLLISPQVTVSDGGAAIPNGTTISSINYSTPSITLSNSATATIASETVTVNIPAFGQITDPGFPTAPSRLGFIEGWLLVNQDGTRTFQTNGPTPYTMTWPASFFALKDSSTDNLITFHENNREGWFVGERTSEVWYNAGGANFSFSRIPGVGPQIGCSAKHSITRLGANLIWLGKNEQGENIVVETQQYAWRRVSNHAIEHAIASYPLVSDAVGYAYEEDGHLFYMLTFPTADVSWVYDATASRNYGAPCWHKRLSYDPNLGLFHRHRSACYMDFADLRLVGDYQTGQIHQMSRNFFSDNGNPLKCQRRTPHVWNRETRKRIFQSQLQVEFTPGVGLQTGQGSNPQAMLRWSNDGGFTWSNEHWQTIGSVGQTRNRAIWRRLGRARDRVYELNYTDPTARDIVGATLFGEGEEESEAA